MRRTIRPRSIRPAAGSAAGFLAGVAAVAALAGAPAPAAAGALTLAVDHNVRLPLAGPAGSVVVGNPAVADVTVVDSRSVFVSGRGPGSTDVTVVDPLGRVVFSGEVKVVAEPGAHVVIHRGSLVRADLSCDPTCSPSSSSSAPAGVRGTPDPGANPAGVVANALGGAVAGAASGAVGAVTGPPKPS